MRDQMYSLFRSVVPLLGLAVLVLGLQSARADLADPGLAGQTKSAEWRQLTAGAYPGYGGFPGSGTWPAPLAPQFTTNGGESAGVIKVANGPGGGPYPASGSIYYGGFSGDINYNGGKLAVVENNALANLAKVVFQIEIGEAWTYDFFNRQLPVLDFNGGTQSLAANSTTVSKVSNGTVTMPTGEEEVFINTYRMEWDLAGIAVPIDTFAISFTGVQHAQLYEMRLDQGSVSAVPEPTSMALGTVLVGGVIGRRLLRRKGDESDNTAT